MATPAPAPTPQSAPPNNPSYTLWQMVWYFLHLGTTGFGGPVALVGYMHRELVERRNWISEAEYKEGLALAQLAPGPLAAQLAIYLGYVHYRIIGATLVGLAFVLPSFLMVVAIGWAYTNYQGLPWMQAVFYGVGAAVIAIVGMSAYKLTNKSIGKDRLLWVIYLVSAAITAITQTEMVGVFLAGGILVWWVRQPPQWLRRNGGTAAGLGLPLAQLAAPTLAQGLTDSVLFKIGIFFAKAGAFVFGSGLAIVPFLYSAVVKDYHWLNDAQFLDAVAVAMITPGPVVITVGFIGYVVAGFAGASVAAAATFLPCYLITIAAAPYFKKYGHHPGLKAFVDGVTAAAVGAITGAVIVLAQRTLVDWASVTMMLITAVALWRFKKLTEPVVILVAAMAGIALYPLLHS